jgi:hypothetical protein
MAEIKTHPTYGEVAILQSSSALVEIEVGGDSFWITAASFTKKKAKPRAKRKKVVHKLDEPGIDALLVCESRAEESEPEVFDAVEEIVQESELEEENEEAEDVA